MDLYEILTGRMSNGGAPAPASGQAPANTGLREQLSSLLGFPPPDEQPSEARSPLPLGPMRDRTPGIGPFQPVTPMRDQTPGIRRMESTAAPDPAARGQLAELFGLPMPAPPQQGAPGPAQPPVFGGLSTQRGR